MFTFVSCHGNNRWKDDDKDSVQVSRCMADRWVEAAERLSPVSSIMNLKAENGSMKSGSGREGVVLAGNVRVVVRVRPLDKRGERKAKIGGRHEG